MAVNATLGTRAVSRLVKPRNSVRCSGCHQEITWKAKQGRSQRQVIANVYSDDGARWDRVEHFHEGCYVEAGQPHGAVA